MYFIQRDWKFVWHQIVKVTMIYGFLLLDFVTSAMKEYFFRQDRKKRGIIIFYENFKFKSHPFIEFYFIRKEGERYKNFTRMLLMV